MTIPWPHDPSMPSELQQRALPGYDTPEGRKDWLRCLSRWSESHPSICIKSAELFLQLEGRSHLDTTTAVYFLAWAHLELGNLEAAQELVEATQRLLLLMLSEETECSERVEALDELQQHLGRPRLRVATRLTRL
jgi:hypothetical protein